MEDVTYHNDVTEGDQPTIMVTNDDGIEAPGLQALVRVLVSPNRYRVWVCAPDSDRSAVSHAVTVRGPLSAKPTEISGATAFAVSEMATEQVGLFSSSVPTEQVGLFSSSAPTVSITIGTLGSQYVGHIFSTNMGPLVGTQAAETMANHAEKPEKFSGTNFKRWQQKMLFYLTTLNLARFLTENAPEVSEETSDVQSVSAVKAWKHFEYLCKNYVLNGLADSLYNVYCSKKTVKDLWKSLDRTYRTEDAGTKKFIVARFLDFKMVDSKTVMNQVQELQIILSEIASGGMVLGETFQVAAIIEKLPPSWLDFKNYLKHKRKEMTVEDLLVHLRIEEDNRLAQKSGQVEGLAKANIVEHGQNSRGNGNKGKGSRFDKKNKGKVGNLGPKNGGVKKKVGAFKGKCYNYGESGHRADQCKNPKKEKRR